MAGYELDRWQSSLLPPPTLTKTVTHTATATATETLTNTRTVAPGTLELELFADWHGDGMRQYDEPLIEDAVLELTGEGRKDSVRTGGHGRYVLERIIDGGRYRLSFAGDYLDSHLFRFLSLPEGSFRSISNGYEFIANLCGAKMSVGLTHGFLTLPFPQTTIQQYEPSFVDIDLRAGSWIDWRGDEQTYDGHAGTDFIIREGTKILAAAPGKVTRIAPDPNGGMSVWIDHFVAGYSTFYSHLKEVSVAAGGKLSRGELIGLSGSSVRCRKPNGEYYSCHASHLHFEVDRNGRYVDPYRSLVSSKGSTQSLWTRDNDPQFPLTS